MFNFNNSVNKMSEKQILENEILLFNSSQDRLWMVAGDKYYRSNNDINQREILKSLDSGGYEIDKSKANNKIAHGFMKNLVDEKIAYLLSKDYSLQCEDKTVIEKVKGALGKHFSYTLTGLGYAASNKGKAWLQVYIDEQGQFKTMIIPAEQCVPIWTDNNHVDLEGMIRYYNQVVYEGQTRKDVTKVEYWTAEGLQFFELIDNKLVPDIERLIEYGYTREDFGDQLAHYKKGDEQRVWGKVPFICFKNNRIEYPDVRFVKSLVDNYDKSRSDVSNFLEDVKNLIYVLKNYGGEDLAEFMKDLNYYRAIKVDDDGGVDTLNPTLDISAAKEHYEQLKRDINEFGQGVPKDLDKFGSSPSGIALKFLYSGLDLKCNALEVEFKRGFEELLFFIQVYLSDSGQGSFSNIDVDIIFNRDVKINETETITNCVNSEGIVSDETIVANHPWVKDVEEEIKKVAAEKQNKIKQQQDAFGLNIETQPNGSGVNGQ